MRRNAAASTTVMTSAGSGAEKLDAARGSCSAIARLRGDVVDPERLPVGGRDSEGTRRPADLADLPDQARDQHDPLAGAGPASAVAGELDQIELEPQVRHGRQIPH